MPNKKLSNQENSFGFNLQKLKENLPDDKDKRQDNLTEPLDDPKEKSNVSTDDSIEEINMEVLNAYKEPPCRRYHWWSK